MWDVQYLMKMLQKHRKNYALCYLATSTIAFFSYWTLHGYALVTAPNIAYPKIILGLHVPLTVYITMRIDDVDHILIQQLYGICIIVLSCGKFNLLSGIITISDRFRKILIKTSMNIF